MSLPLLFVAISLARLFLYWGGASQQTSSNEEPPIPARERDLSREGFIYLICYVFGTLPRKPRWRDRGSREQNGRARREEREEEKERGGRENEGEEEEKESGEEGETEERARRRANAIISFLLVVILILSLQFVSYSEAHGKDTERT